MWTRAPSVTSSDCLALDHDFAEVGGAKLTPRFHHRGVSNHHHQPGEQELLLLQDTPPPTTKPLDFHTLLDAPTIHHDLPKPPGSFKRLPSTRRGAFSSEPCFKLSPMSTPELASVVLVARVRHLQPPPTVAKTTTSTTTSVSLVRKPQLDDMQTTVQITNAHTVTPASSNSDQEVPEVVLPSPSKRRRVPVYNVFPELNEALSPEGCEDSGLTGEQHMADLDRPSKSSTPEDIDSAAHAITTSTSELATPQCDTTSSPGINQQQVIVLEQDQNVTVTDVVDPEVPGLQIVTEPLQLHFSASAHEQTDVVVPATTNSPGDDDTHYSTSQFLPPAGHIRVPQTSRISHYNTVTQTMAGGDRDEWLQLSLGSHNQSDVDEPPASTVPLELLYGQQSTQPIQNAPTSSTTTPGIRDFFSFGAGTSQSEEATTSSHRNVYTGGESSKQHYYYYSEPAASHGPTTLPRPLFLEPRPRDYNSTWQDPNVHTPRVRPEFSNLASLPYHPARVLQPVRSEPGTDTTSVHAWRSSAHEAGPSSSGPRHLYAHSEAPWMDPSPGNPAEFLSMATPTFRDWRPSSTGGASSFLSMQPPTLMAQPGVDPEQAWRNLLQRVGNNMHIVVPSMSSGAARASESGAMLPPNEREEYLEALKRAVERFQGADQPGGKDEPGLTELQRLHRSAAMFPPGQQRPHPFDPSTDISLTSRFYSTAPFGSSGSKARAAAGPAPSSERGSRRNIIQLRPHAPRPGLWFTLQASNSQPERPEASPLQQIPTAYIRVVDDTMTVAAVRRYLVNKLGLASEDEVELTCKGQALQPSISLHQVRDGIWQSPNTNTPTPNTPQLLSEGKAWKAPDGSITLVGDVVMVLTYGRRPQAPAPPPTSTV